METYEIDFSSDPSFNTVTGLTNITFNPSTMVENRMATEAQIQQLYQDIVAAEQRRDYCCRDIIVWEARTQVVRLNTNTAISTGQGLTSGGVVVSSWDENVNIGTMRRGLKYTVTFPLKWNKGLYYPVTPERGINLCGPNEFSPSESLGSDNAINRHLANVQFRYLEDDNNIYGASRCGSTVSNRADFFLGNSALVASQSPRIAGKMVNSGLDWSAFTRDVKEDGTVTITDNRRNTNYNIIRFYTQWTLNVCGDGTLLSANESIIYPNGRPDPVW